MPGKPDESFHCVYKLKITVGSDADKYLPVVGDWMIRRRLIDHLCEVARDLPVVISKCGVDFVHHLFTLENDCTAKARHNINKAICRVSSFRVQT